MKIPLSKDFFINVNKEGYPIVGFLFLFSTLIFAFSGFSRFFILSFALMLFCISFFRDPQRILPDIELSKFIISGADGVITSIEESKMPAELEEDGDEKYTKISVFLSVFNVHVNRNPVSGKVLKVRYIKGKFFNATLDKSSTDNERNLILVENEAGLKVAFSQIAGFIARRIVNHTKENDSISIGDRYGIIKFGSRFDIYIPSEYKVLVSVGQTVIGGETKMAIFNK